MRFRHVRRGGRQVRVADPAWQDPLDGRYSGRVGGRWNDPGSFPVVYLAASNAVARAFVERKLRGQPFRPEDLDPSEAPVLVVADVPPDDHVDVVTDRGCAAAGLPVTYPWEDGREVGWERCRPVGARAWEEGERGIACRSVATQSPAGGEELAWFQRRERLRLLATVAFDEWFWPTAGSGPDQPGGV